MKPLKGGIPRVFLTHRSAIARRYRAYCEAWIRRAGRTLPADVLPTIRDAGWATVELERLTHDLEKARTRRRLKDARRLRREMAVLRGQRLALERHLTERLADHAGRQPLRLEDLVAGGSR